MSQRSPWTGPLGPETGVLIAAGGLSLFFVFVALLDLTGCVSFRLAPVSAVFGSLIVLNVMLAPWASRWASWPRAAVLYETFHAIVLTSVLHFLGGPGLGVFVIVYAFLVVHTEILRPGASPFATATACAACYGGLCVLYLLGWLEEQSVWQIHLTMSQQGTFAVFTLLSLNFLALYVHHHSAQLRGFTDRLQETVAERTDALRTANTELVAKTAMLERQQNEHRSFVYTVTHDLKAPVRSIFIIAERLLCDEESGRPPRAELEQLTMLAGRTQDMLRDLLDMFRATADVEAVVRVDLGDLTREVVESLRLKFAEKGTAVTVGALPVVDGQRKKLRHVIANLIENAADFVRPGEGVIAISGDRRNGKVVLCIADNGVGIPPAYHRAIFDLFRQVPHQKQALDRPRGGTGIGLAIVNRIVADHGGRVWVESALSAGSRFFIELPDPTKGDGTAAVRGGPILVVDDDVEFLHMVTAIIEKIRRGVAVHAVETGNDAMAAFAPGGPENGTGTPAALILDFHLPDTDGATLLRRIRSESSGHRIPTLVLSNALSPEEETELRLAHVEKVALKPTAREDLSNLIREFLDRETV